jgi:hypothetical protein
VGARAVPDYLEEIQHFLPMPGLQPRIVSSVGFLRTTIIYGGLVVIVKKADVPSFQVLLVWYFTEGSKKTTGIFRDMAQIQNGYFRTKNLQI